jgi:hypothetical protein
MNKAESLLCGVGLVALAEALKECVEFSPGSRCSDPWNTGVAEDRKKRSLEKGGRFSIDGQDRVLYS